MNWVLVLWFYFGGSMGSATINGLSKKGCEEQALSFMRTENLTVIALCVEKK